MTLALVVMLPLTPYRPTARDIGCTTKVPFPTKSQAKKHWKWLRRQPGRRHLQIYPCRYCPDWHIGNPPGHQTYWRSGSPFSSGHDTAPNTPEEHTSPWQARPSSPSSATWSTTPSSASPPPAPPLRSSA